MLVSILGRDTSPFGIASRRASGSKICQIKHVTLPVVVPPLTLVNKGAR